MLNEYDWILRCTYAPALVAAASLLPRLPFLDPAKIHRRSGLLAALPFVAGPILYNLAISSGAEAAAEGAQRAVPAMLAYIAFCACCAASAGLLTTRFKRPTATALTLLGGILAFLIAGTGVYLLPPPNLALAAAAVLAALAAFWWRMPRLSCDGRESPKPPFALELGAKVFLAFLASLGAHLTARWLGNAGGGVASIFPVATSVMVAGCLLTAGPVGLRQQLRGIARGATGLLGFLLTLALSLDASRIHTSFLLAYLVAFAVQALTGYLLKRLS